MKHICFNERGLNIMIMDELREKYGDTVILGVAGEHIEGMLKEGFTAVQEAKELEKTLATHLEPRPRCEAELDFSFKQIIPYLVIDHTPSGRVFAMLRTGGDDRLVGQASLGLGGHMDDGETFLDCLYREVMEEVGLARGEIRDLELCGYIYSNDSEVDSVHLGMIYRAGTDKDALTCLEGDKLTGAWLTPHELIILNCENKLESWSRIAYESLLREDTKHNA